jgi:hypothetical protein
VLVARSFRTYGIRTELHIDMAFTRLHFIMIEKQEGLAHVALGSQEEALRAFYSDMIPRSQELDM